MKVKNLPAAALAAATVTIDATTGAVIAPTLQTAATEMGRAHGVATVNAIEEAAAALIGDDGLAKLAQETPEGYRQTRDWWCAGYKAATMCNDKTAQNRWALVYRAAALIKPRTEGAARMDAKRRAAGVPKKGEAKGEKMPASPASGTGEAGRIIMELAASEAHMVHLIRAGKWKEATEYLAELATLR